MKPAPINELIDCLTGGEPQRVPSLLVTVFGELAQEEGTRISGSVLGNLMELFGVKPEAVRVALHRLRKDGWIESHRNGRNSAYALTELGRAESAKASPRIYRETPVANEAWLVVADPVRPSAPNGQNCVWVSANVFVTGALDSRDGSFATRLEPGTALPAWMLRKICEPELAEMSDRLSDRFAQLRQRLEPGRLPIEVAALRVLIVHSWRRIVLKAPDLPDHVFPEPWQGIACRASMSDLLSRLPKPDVADLEDHAPA